MASFYHKFARHLFTNNPLSSLPNLSCHLCNMLSHYSVNFLEWNWEIACRIMREDFFQEKRDGNILFCHAMSNLVVIRQTENYNDSPLFSFLFSVSVFSLLLHWDERLTMSCERAWLVSQTRESEGGVWFSWFSPADSVCLSASLFVCLSVSLCLSCLGFQGYPKLMGTSNQLRDPKWLLFWHKCHIIT